MLLFNLLIFNFNIKYWKSENEYLFNEPTPTPPRRGTTEFIFQISNIFIERH